MLDDNIKHFFLQMVCLLFDLHLVASTHTQNVCETNVVIGISVRYVLCTEASYE